MEMRSCPLCLKPAALQSCCPLGKSVPMEWNMDQMLLFLDVLKGSQHKWHRFGSLGEIVDAPLNQGGYKEIFRRERLIGRSVIGKQRKTISDTMKRFGIGNVKHRDLICEALYDLSKPTPKIPDETMLEELSMLVKNSWTSERRPDIQHQALTDILRISADPDSHEALQRLGMAETLMEIVSGPMMDPEMERKLEEQQKEINELKARRKKNELDYNQKKELDRKEFRQAKDWIQRKADFGNLAVTSFCIFQNFSAGSRFKTSLAKERFCSILVKQLSLFKEAEKSLQFLKAVGRGQFLNLVSSEAVEQQLVILSIILNLSTDVENRIVLVNHGISRAVISLAMSGSLKDSPTQLKCLQILSNLASTNGETEERIVQDGALNVLVPILRDGFGDILHFALATLSHLAFVQANKKSIIDAGSLMPISNILRRGQSNHQLRAIDVIRNLSAAGVDEKLIVTVVRDLVGIIEDQNQGSEHQLRSLIALRSLGRFEQALQTFCETGVIELAVSLSDGADPRMRLQALGLLVNVLGNTATVLMDAGEEDDEMSDDETLESSSSNTNGHDSASSDFDPRSDRNSPESKSTESSNGAPIRRAFKAMQQRISPFLRLLTIDELQLLASDCPYIFLPKGGVLASEGEAKESAFVVVKGVLRVLVNTANLRVSKEIEISDDTRLTVKLGEELSAESLQGAKESSKLLSERGEIDFPLKGSTKPGRSLMEVMRLRNGETACELCLLEKKPSAGTITALTDCIVLEIGASSLVKLLRKRSELANLISPGESAVLSMRDQLRKLWSHPTICDEISEQVNLSRMEVSHVRIKVQKLLIQMGALRVFEAIDAWGPPGKLLVKVGISLLIGGPDTKDSPLMEVDEETVMAIQEAVDCSQKGKDWHGHFYRLTTLLLASRLMVLNDKNKRQFIRCSMIPWILRLVKVEADDETIRLATSILLSLSFAMRARWLLRPIMVIWLRFVKSQKATREKSSKAPPSTRTVDIAAPFRTINETVEVSEDTFEVELHEAASEGGVLWMQRLVEENGVDPNVVDSGGASALHFAALGGKRDAIVFLLDRGVMINIRDGAGCTALGWIMMAKQLEFGMDKKAWPESWKRLVAWLLEKGAEATYLPAFPFSV